MSLQTELLTGALMREGEGEKNGLKHERIGKQKWEKNNDGNKD